VPPSSAKVVPSWFIKNCHQIRICRRNQAKHLGQIGFSVPGGAGWSSVSRRGPVTIAGSQSNYDVALFTVCFFVAFDYGARMHRNQWADNSSFAISGSNLITRGTIAREPYAVSISAT
jgi:hypothetical protein